MLAPPALDPDRVRADFPALAQSVHDRPLVYLDNASTAQKPRAVIEAVRRMYERECANVHRGVHALSAAATQAYEGAREKARRFLGAADVREIVLTHGTTSAINLVAQSFGRAAVGPGDVVLCSVLEHHSNLVPWQMLCAERGATLEGIPVDDHGQLDLERFAAMLSPRTRIVALSHVSNAIGTVTPVREVVRCARRKCGAAVVVDGAQAVPHLRVDVKDLDCDFYCFSGHKLFGPTGVGVLYGKRERLLAMAPWQGGGDMIRSVSFERTEYAEPPYRFEAGTPNIAGVVGLGAAIDYVEAIGHDAILAHERALLAHGTRVLTGVPGLRLIGTAEDKAPILSFVLAGVHPHDIGTVLDHEGIAIRTGHHCAEPLMQRFGVAGTARASFAFYNTVAEVDALGRALAAVGPMFR
jgi:cysteine desulfurase/selenocysteine lyase